VAQELRDAGDPRLGPVAVFQTRLGYGDPGGGEDEGQHEDGSLKAKTHVRLLVREAGSAGRD